MQALHPILAPTGGIRTAGKPIASTKKEKRSYAPARSLATALRNVVNLVLDMALAGVAVLVPVLVLGGSAYVLLHLLMSR